MHGTPVSTRSFPRALTALNTHTHTPNHDPHLAHAPWMSGLVAPGLGLGVQCHHCCIQVARTVVSLTSSTLPCRPMIEQHSPGWNLDQIEALTDEEIRADKRMRTVYEVTTAIAAPRLTPPPPPLPIPIPIPTFAPHDDRASLAHIPSVLQDTLATFLKNLDSPDFATVWNGYTDGRSTGDSKKSTRHTLTSQNANNASFFLRAFLKRKGPIKQEIKVCAAPHPHPLAPPPTRTPTPSHPHPHPLAPPPHLRPSHVGVTRVWAVKPFPLTPTLAPALPPPHPSGHPPNACRGVGL
jgi:hypothetical protein